MRRSSLHATQDEMIAAGCEGAAAAGRRRGCERQDGELYGARASGAAGEVMTSPRKARKSEPNCWAAAGGSDPCTALRHTAGDGLRDYRHREVREPGVRYAGGWHSGRLVEGINQRNGGERKGGACAAATADAERGPGDWGGRCELCAAWRLAGCAPGGGTHAGFVSECERTGGIHPHDRSGAN